MIQTQLQRTTDTSPEPAEDDRCAHILVVDDEQSIVEMLRLLLEDEGFQVTGVTSGLGALQSLVRRRTDLIITDVMMPGMSGYELARAAISIKPAIRVIFMSAVTNAARAGTHPFLAKPFDLATVVETIEAELRVS